MWSPPKWLLGVADPNIAHRKRSTFYVLEECETEEGEHGFWVFDEETGEEGLTGLYTNNEFWVLGAKGSYSKRRIHGRSFKKGKPKGYGKKGKDQDPASVRGQKEKVMQHGTMTSKTRLSGEKERQEGQERNERKGFFQRNAFMERKRQGRWQERRKTIEPTIGQTKVHRGRTQEARRAKRHPTCLNHQHLHEDRLAHNGSTLAHGKFYQRHLK